MTVPPAHRRLPPVTRTLHFLPRFPAQHLLNHFDQILCSCLSRTFRQPQLEDQKVQSVKRSERSMISFEQRKKFHEILVHRGMNCSCKKDCVDRREDYITSCDDI
ncbi:hypothetical protein SAY87_025401 [Trapa incisa]|uniref:Uncharacterized protein n=1 Tax=Trapa incisa TaxID=236973 RepID=A0AAN7GLE2_9MYRT|nr:hypothetical protein SAY87_025401 [Trapa incisa]